MSHLSSTFFIFHVMLHVAVPAAFEFQAQQGGMMRSQVSATGHARANRKEVEEEEEEQETWSSPPAVQASGKCETFVMGTKGAATCNAGTVAVSSVQQCQEYASKSGRTVDPRCNHGNYEWWCRDRPVGCWQESDGRYFYNKGPTGKAYAPVTPVCCSSTEAPEPRRCACDNPGHSTFSECTQSTSCACNGRVRLGYDTRWSEWQDVTGSIICSNGNFGGDPAPGQAKECVCDSTAPRLQTVEGFTAEAEGQGSACRGAHADDNRASYYTVHYSKSLQACKARCMATPVCSGIEFSTGRCELWTRSIDATRALASYTCLRYTPLQRGSNLAVIQTHGSRESHRRRRRSLNLKPAALSVA